MKTQSLITMGLLLGLNAGLRADFESPGTGPDLNALIGGDGDRDWNFWVRTFVGYNDNVQLVPDGVFFSADQESGYVGLSAQGSYRLLNNGNINAGAAFRFDQTFHFESSRGAAAPDNFDLTVFEPLLYLNYTSDSWYGRLTYSYRWEDAKSTLLGVSSHNIGLMIGTEINPCLRGELSWTHGWDDFHTRGAGVAERDGERDKVSLSLIHQAADNAPRFILRYSYLDNDADGSNFRYDGYELAFRVETPLTNDLGVVAQVSYTDIDYSTGGRNEQELLRAGVRFVYVIDQNWSADVYYDYLDIDSDSTFFRGSQNNVGVGLRYDF